MITKTIMTLMLVAFLGVITGCETIEGFGQDTKHAGQKIENAADRNK